MTAWVHHPGTIVLSRGIVVGRLGEPLQLPGSSRFRQEARGLQFSLRPVLEVRRG
jgi:hypothetical protein